MFVTVGSCPRCGAPIYAPSPWFSITAPPSYMTCTCIPQPQVFTGTTMPITETIPSTQYPWAVDWDLDENLLSDIALDCRFQATKLGVTAEDAVNPKFWQALFASYSRKLTEDSHNALVELGALVILAHEALHPLPLVEDHEEHEEQD